jgi:hypothetical protein
VLREKNPDPARGFLVNVGRALNAAEVIANEAPPPSASAAFGQGPEVQILSIRPIKHGLVAKRENRRDRNGRAAL